MASKMTSNPVEGNGNGSGSGKRPKADWNDKNSDIFLKCCIEQVCAGNRPHAHFNKVGWTNLIKSFNEQTGLSYEYKQIKNKWDILRKDWQAWAKLVGKETGLGWDNSRQTIAASEEWWEAKIKVYPEVAKFKKEGPRNLVEMEILFKDTVATGTGAWAPSQDPQEEAGKNSNEMCAPMTEERGLEDLGLQGDEYEGIEDLTTDPSPSSQRQKRKRGGRDNKRGSVGHRMCEQFDRIIESLNSENTVTSSNVSNVPTLAECLDMLKQLPGLEYGGEIHIIGIRLMKSKANRETFVLLNDPVLQLNWIKSHTLADVSRH